MFKTWKRIYLSLVTVAGLSALASLGCRTHDSHTSQPVVELRPGIRIQFRGGNSSAPGQPGDTDSNSPLHWAGDTLFLFNSSGHPWRSSGPDLFHLDQSYLRCEYNNQAQGGRWIEATWKDPSGPLYGWYHFEPTGLCPGTGLTAPRIGAARSDDNGAHWKDLGLVLESPPGTLNCATPNHYFAWGNGDFSVMVDQKSHYAYFFISTYAGPTNAQGVAVARMKWADRDAPRGKVWKWHRAEWREPGLGGQVTPIFPARVDWHQPNADAFWGPSIHYNYALKQYVILLNRAIDKEWAQEGIYISFSRDLSNPQTWTPPAKLLGGLATNQWYPQVVGMDRARRETDKAAGARARLFVRGESHWEIIFSVGTRP
jgi:hypothetical protein